MRIFSVVLLLFLVYFPLVAQQQEKTVSLTSSGIGRTQDEAKQNALRSAIEQAFGTFISSKTEILNDDLVKDEVVSVSNGNIQQFEVISEVKLPDNSWNTTLNATVSVTKLASFVESKGGTVEFKGAMLAFNLNQQKLNEKNEIKAMDDMMKVVKELADNAFNFEINATEPTAVEGSSDKFKIPLAITGKANDNFASIPKIILSTLKGVSLTTLQADDYIKLKKYIYPVSYAASETEYGYFILRTEESLKRLLEIVYYFNHALTHFKITNGVAEFTLAEKPDGLQYIYDKSFRPLLKNYTFGHHGTQCWPESVFYMHFEYDFYDRGIAFGVVENTFMIKKSLNIGVDNTTSREHKIINVNNYQVQGRMYPKCNIDDMLTRSHDHSYGQIYFLNYKYWLDDLPTKEKRAEREKYNEFVYQNAGLIPAGFYIKFPYGFPEYQDPSNQPQIKQNVQLPGELGKVVNDFNALKNSFSGFKKTVKAPKKEMSLYVRDAIKSLTSYKGRFNNQFSFVSNLKGYESNGFDPNFKINGYATFNKMKIENLNYLSKPEDIQEFLSEMHILEAGLVLSFIGIKPGTSVVRFDYEDIRTIEEINQMQGYSVVALGNYAAATPAVPETQPASASPKEKERTPEPTPGVVRTEVMSTPASSAPQSIPSSQAVEQGLVQSSLPSDDSGDDIEPSEGYPVSNSDKQEDSGNSINQTPELTELNSSIDKQEEVTSQSSGFENTEASNPSAVSQSQETSLTTNSSGAISSQNSLPEESSSLAASDTVDRVSQTSSASTNPPISMGENLEIKQPNAGPESQAQELQMELSGVELQERTLTQKSNLQLSHHKAGKVLFAICIDPDGTVSDLELNVVKSTIVSEKIIAQLKEHAMSLSFTPAENKHSCGTLIFKVPGKANSVTTAPVELQAPRQEFPIQEETEVNSSTSQNRHVPDNQAEQSSPVVASQSVSQPVQSDVKTASSPEKAVVPQEKIVSPAAVATSVNASQQARDVNQNAQMQSPSKPAVQAESKPLPTNVTQTEKAQSSASIPNTAVTSNSMKLGVMDNISLEIKGIDLQTRKILSVPDIENYSNEKGSIFFNFCVDKNGIVTYIQYDMNQTDDVSNKLISMIQTKARTFVFAASGKEEECGTFEFKLKKIKY